MITKTKPRAWTKEDIKKLLELKKTHSNAEISKILNRSEVSISIKLKRLTKKNGSYNEKHVLEKHNLNDEFISVLKPKNILDVFSGEKSYYKKFENIKTTTNDINSDFENDYKMDYLKLLCKLYAEDKKYDLIDLDPFGSAYDGFDLAIKMAKKGLIITLGEIGHLRFKRLDYVRYRYNIKDLEDFTVSKIIEEIKKIGLRNKKTLKEVFVANWKNITRIYFQIEKFKIVEQWENKENKNQMSIFDIMEERNGK